MFDVDTRVHLDNCRRQIVPFACTQANGMIGLSVCERKSAGSLFVRATPHQWRAIVAELRRMGVS